MQSKARYGWPTANLLRACMVRACDWRELTVGLWDRLIGFKQQVGLMAQGQQRGLDPTGKVFAFREPSQQLLVRGSHLINCLGNC